MVCGPCSGSTGRTTCRLFVRGRSASRSTTAAVPRFASYNTYGNVQKAQKGAAPALRLPCMQGRRQTKMWSSLEGGKVQKNHSNIGLEARCCSPPWRASGSRPHDHLRLLTRWQCGCCPAKSMSPPGPACARHHAPLLCWGVRQPALAHTRLRLGSRGGRGSGPQGRSTIVCTVA